MRMGPQALYDGAHVRSVAACGRSVKLATLLSTSRSRLFQTRARRLYNALMTDLMSDDIKARRRRAAYRAAHRGSKEMDALIGRYADARLSDLDGERLNAFERLLSIPDPTLQAWIFADAASAGPGEFAAIVSDIRAFHGLNAPSKAGR